MNSEPLEIRWNEMTILKSIGYGGHATVSKGLWGNQIVAVKSPHLNPQSNEKTVEDLVRKEAKFVHKLHHRNIIYLLGICVEQKNYCLVLEYCSGGSLRSVIESHELPTPTVANWALQVARGLFYLHNQTVSVVHRDLKSANVLIKIHGTNDVRSIVLKITDFGVTRETNDTTQMSDLRGTVSHIAPEVCQNLFSTASDIWSYGVLLWELITRQTPYAGKHKHHIIFGIGRGILHLPIPKDCHLPLKQILNQCWERNPHNRPTCIQMIEKLKTMINDYMMAITYKEWCDINSLVLRDDADLISSGSTSWDSNSVLEIRRGLRTHYTTDLEYINRNWFKFGTVKDRPMKTFYNENVEIVDINRKLKMNFESFKDILQSDFKRICLYGDAGCRKSTYLHNFALQWSNGTMSLMNSLLFILLFRMGELKSIDCISVQILLQKCLAPTQAAFLVKLIEDQKFLEKTMFIFDGLDELNCSLSNDIEEIIYGTKPHLPYVVVSVQRQNYLRQENIGQYLLLKLNGFTDEGVTKQLQLYDREITEEYKKNVKYFINNPLFLNMLLYIPAMMSDSCCLWQFLDRYIKQLERSYICSDQDFDRNLQQLCICKLQRYAIAQMTTILPVKVPEKSSQLKTDYEFDVIQCLSEVELKFAKDIGYVQKRSTCDRICFPHPLLLTILLRNILQKLSMSSRVL